MENKRDIWWREYRRRINRPRARNMSLELVIRTTFRKTLKAYLQNCSFAGVSKVFDQSYGLRQRLIHVAIIAAMFGSIFYFLQYVWYGSLANPLVVTMESSTYPISNIQFPAITLCNFNRISKKFLKDYVRRHYRELALKNESIHEVELFCIQLVRLLDFSYNKTMQLHPLLLSFANYLGDSNNITKLMEKLSPPCNEMLIRCSWSGQRVDCDKIFSVHRTAHGFCCAFNLVLRYDSNGRLDTSIYTVKRQHDAGQLHGLNVILDSMADDYTYRLYNMVGFEVLIFDPTHYADPTGGRVITRIAQPNQAVFFEINSVKQIATAEVRKYPTKTRQCHFHDEMKEEFNELYSYSTCIIKCRARTIESLCKCTPFFFPVLSNHGSICTLDDLKCLNKYREKLFYLYPKDAVNTEGLEAELQDSLYCEECLPDCELTQHFTKHFKIPLSHVVNKNKEFTTFFFDGLNMTDKCMLSIYQATADGVLNRLDTVFYWYEIVSNIGGFCSILVGFSIISIIELLYYFLVRFLINLSNFYNEYG